MRNVTSLSNILAVILAALAIPPLNGHGASTINSTNRFAYGANIGWVDWRGDGANGAVIGEFVCSGYIYSANVGWIHLGGGAPENGIRYGNASASDFGVNHDGAGNLRGFAYCANVGWLTFGDRDATGASYDGPRVDLLTGRLSGYIYGANIGWISLSNAVAHVRTDSIPGGFDSDGDSIPDSWEFQHAGNLTTLDGSGDFDGDGVPNSLEYLADTDPADPASNLRITDFIANAGGTANTITFTSRPTRLYTVQERATLTPDSTWVDAGLGTIRPDSGTTTTRSFSDAASLMRFFRVEARRP